MLDRIWLIRHGSTSMQEERRYCGHADPPLSPLGEEQMRRLARRLPLAGAAAFWASDLRRAVESAALLAPEAVPRRTPGLREIDFGAWEGLRFEQTGCADAEELRDIGFRFPAGESARTVAARVAEALEEIMAGTAAPAGVLVAHRGSLAMVALRLLGEPWARFWSYQLPCGGAAELERRDGTWHVAAADWEAA